MLAILKQDINNSIKHTKTCRFTKDKNDFIRKFGEK